MMQAWAVEKAGGPEALQRVELPRPTISQPRDILVKVKAVALNPIDFKIRKSHAGPNKKILGWDASGIVEAVGSETQFYKVGDEVYFAGSLVRDGCFAEYVLVDERIVGRKPTNLSWEQAAAEPLTVLTAWEGMVEHMHIPIPAAGTKSQKTLLVIAGAGGVGTCAIQLGKNVLGLRVVATANREESIKTCKDLGADFTVKHGEPLQPQLKALGIDGVDYVMHCWDAESLWEELGTIVNPLGHIGIIATTVEQLAMKQFWYKGISVSWELMFTRSMFGTTDIHVQRDILNKAAELLESGTFKPRMTKCYEWADLLDAHKLVESGKAVGKIAVRLP